MPVVPLPSDGSPADPPDSPLDVVARVCVHADVAAMQQATQVRLALGRVALRRSGVRCADVRRSSHRALAGAESNGRATGRIRADVCGDLFVDTGAST
jgi:hypothetical protein